MLKGLGRDGDVATGAVDTFDSGANRGSTDTHAGDHADAIHR